MSKRPKPFVRMCWGVEFTGSDGGNPVLLGSLYEPTRGPLHVDEPIRVLLFRTRRAARAWCAEEHAQFAGRTDCCEKWRFRPVRVRETVRVVAIGKSPHRPVKAAYPG